MCSIFFAKIQIFFEIITIFAAKRHKKAPILTHYNTPWVVVKMVKVKMVKMNFGFGHLAHYI